MSLSNRSLSRTCAVAAAVAVAAIALPAASASAAESAPLAESELTLSIIPEYPDEWNQRTVVALNCGPAGGNHPDPEWACAALEEVDGRFEDLKSYDMCYQIWDPVTIIATGTWQGRAVSYSEVVTNRACAAVGSNYVFSF